MPRHAFAPEVPAQKAYTDDIIATRHADDGRITSSVSAPWLQADMLEAARIQPGHRVLEIGSGGYNAALIAELVGPTGSVTTLDIDPAVTDRATRFLTETGYDRVRVVTADAEHLPVGIVPDCGFDAIMVTVDTWDLPWINALAEGGRLVAPLRLHQYTWAIGFTKRDGALHSDEPLIVCGFVAMQGAGAWNDNRRTVPGTGVHLCWEDGTPLPVDQLAPALDSRTVRGAHPRHRRRSGALRCPQPLPGRRLARLLPPLGRPRRRQQRPQPAAPVLARRGHRARRLPRAADHRAHRRRRRRQRRVRAGRPRLRSRRPPGRQGDGRTGPALAAQPPRRPLPAHHRPAPDRPRRHSHRRHRTCSASGTPRSRSTGPSCPAPRPCSPTTRAATCCICARRTSRSGGPGQWALLGGNTEKGEHPDEAIARELAEEIGLAIPDLAPFATLDTLDANGAFKDRVRVYHGTLNRPAHEIHLTRGHPAALDPPARKQPR